MQPKFLVRVVLGSAAAPAVVVPAVSLTPSTPAGGTKLPDNPVAGCTAAGSGSGATTVTVPSSVTCTSPSSQAVSSGVVVSGSNSGATATGTLISAASAAKLAPTFPSLSFTGSTIGLGSLGSVSPLGSDMVKGHATVVQPGPLSLDATSFTLTRSPDSLDTSTGRVPLTPSGW